MRAKRWYLALFYALATVLAQGLHDHGGGTDSTEVRHEQGCNDLRPHLSGHWSPDLSHATDHCLACQYRSQHHAHQLASIPFYRLVQAGPVEAPIFQTLTGSDRWFSCRAPPRV